MEELRRVLAQLAGDAHDIAQRGREVQEKAQETVDQGRERHAEAIAFIEHLTDVLKQHGVGTAESCLKLVPIAQAKGDSKAEVDLMIDRFDRGLMANAFITLNPGNKRFPVEVVGTGRIGPQGINVPQMDRMIG